MVLAQSAWCDMFLKVMVRKHRTHATFGRLAKRSTRTWAAPTSTTSQALLLHRVILLGMAPHVNRFAISLRPATAWC